MTMAQNKKSWFTLKNVGETQPVKVWIHGDIGSYDIEAIDLIQALQTVGQQDVEFRIQSYGGSVYEGLAMYNAIKAHKGKTTGIVDGLVASISSYFLMACDEIHMPDNATLMIHNPSISAWGGESEIESALVQLQHSKQTIADAYVERSKQPLDVVLNAMEKETWFTATQALEFGLIDQVIDAVNLTNCLKSVDATQLQSFKNTPIELLNSLNKPTEQPLIPLLNAVIKPLQQGNDMPDKVDKDALNNAVKKENKRQSAIRALCALHKVGEGLLNEMLDDMDCNEALASQKILSNIGAHATQGLDPKKPLNGAPVNLAGYVAGNTQRELLQNAFNARLGVGECAEKDNPYKLQNLMAMAETVVGKDAALCSNKHDLVARAFNTGDFADILTEGIRTVMLDEKKVREPLWKQLARTESMPDFRETELVAINDAPDLMNIAEDGEYKQAVITGTGEKIQLATFGREVAITRHAIINDQISLFAKLPRLFMQSGYRLADKMMFNAILTGKMSDEKGVFVAGTAGKWGNLMTGITANDYQALILALHKSFSTAVTDGGEALDLRGEFILANPDHAPMIEAVLATASKPDSFNAAYNKFKTVIETSRLSGVNGAIALTSVDFESVLMGFLDGQQDPWLETGDGFSSDGAKFRITYDLTSKVVDRRGLAKATFR